MEVEWSGELALSLPTLISRQHLYNLVISLEESGG